MDLKNLRTFLFVAELSSFTKAAERLGFSQPTISFQIKQLESELNVRLFERIRHTVKLTQQGQEVLRYAYQIDQLTQELSNELREDRGIAGSVRLAMADSLCALMAGTFHDFWLHYPDIRLKIIAAGTAEMFQLLNRNDVDLVLTLDHRIYDAEYVIVHEEKAGAHFVAPPDCPLAAQERISIQEIITHPFLLTEKGMSYRRLLDERLAARSLEISPVLETGNVQLICRLVEQGAGCSFLPDYATAPAIASGRLVRLTVDGFEVDIWKQLFCHRNKWISPQIRAVQEYCARL